MDRHLDCVDDERAAVIGTHPDAATAGEVRALAREVRARRTGRASTFSMFTLGMIAAIGTTSGVRDLATMSRSDASLLAERGDLLKHFGFSIASVLVCFGCVVAAFLVARSEDARARRGRLS